MKKTLVALAALSAAAGAFAQSNVTIYGTLDASVAYVKNANAAKQSVTLLNDSAITTSRWGMRGTEDLGGGLKANFNLESDVNMGTGASNTSATGGMFRRAAWVSLASDQFGELRLGRHTSVAVGHLVSGGIVAPNNAMHGTVLIGAGLVPDFFLANAITYVSPSLSGLRASLQYSPGEQAGNSRASSSAQAALKYQGSNFTVGGAYLNMENSATTADGRKWYTVDGTVTLGQVKLGAAYYDVNHNPGAAGKVDNKGYILNGSYQLDPKVMLFAGFIKSLQDSSAVTLQARYALSKRTTVYAMVNHVDNGAEGVNFNPIYIDIPNGAANAKQTAFATGVIHSF